MLVRVTLKFRFMENFRRTDIRVLPTIPRHSKLRLAKPQQQHTGQQATSSKAHSRGRYIDNWTAKKAPISDFQNHKSNLYLSHK